jgi:eukaryotic-like serine/threonine-protein kinase
MSDTAIPGLYPNPGDIVAGKYRIERMLGEGGMGAVARATHLLTRSPVALKFMSPMIVRVDGAVQRFLRESQAAARIRSDHVVQIFDVDKLPTGAPYIAMECMEGRDLEALILEESGKSSAGMDPQRAIHIILHVLRGLQAAHGVGIVHRDMKPSNCYLVTRDSDQEFVKILDFGISKVSDGNKPSATKTNMTLGTPLYMAPEQGVSPKDVDARSDLYAVGSIFYELLTGGPPFQPETGELAEILFKVFTQDVPNIREKRPDLPEGLARAVHHALARKQADRVPTALAFAEALSPFAKDRDQDVIAAMRLYTAPSMEEHDALAMTAPIDAFERLGTRSDNPSEGKLTQAIVPKAAPVPHFTVQVVGSQNAGAGQGRQEVSGSARTEMLEQSGDVASSAFKNTTPMVIASPAIAPETPKGKSKLPLILGVFLTACLGAAGLVVLRPAPPSQGGGAATTSAAPSQTITLTPIYASSTAALSATAPGPSVSGSAGSAGTVPQSVTASHTTPTQKPPVKNGTNPNVQTAGIRTN